MLPLPGSQKLCGVIRYSTGEGLAGLVGVQSQAVNMWEEDATVASLYSQGKFLLIFLRVSMRQCSREENRAPLGK